MTVLVDLGDAPHLNWLACQDRADRAYRLGQRLIVDDDRVGAGYLMMACASYWHGRGEDIFHALPDKQVLMGLDLSDGDDFGARLP